MVDIQASVRCQIYMHLKFELHSLQNEVDLLVINA